ncbi:MAG: LWR-salt protein [Haloarculaceae archaeon]
MSGPVAEYVFHVRFRLDPGETGLRAEPATFETTLFRAADPPRESGWLFFRDNLWHGELSDPEHFRELTAEALGVAVDSVSFRELRIEDGSLDDLKAAVGEDLAAFNADSVSAALSKYLGSSIHVVD